MAVFASMKLLMQLIIIFLSFLMIFFSSEMTSSYLLSYSLWSGGKVNLDFSIFLDYVSLMFSSTVLMIGMSVLIYCNWYMDDEVNFKRFFYLVIFFLMAMMFMIFIPNIYSLILGWDGLGLTSYVLVCYYQNSKSCAAGMLTALTNRVGDVFILLSMSFMIAESSFYLYNYFSFSSMLFLSLFLVVSGMTKSAQLPFCAWLPAAMAAPTPVSALVHSSTLVTAGVYILIRSNYMISLNPYSMLFLKLMSVLTLCLAGSSALLCTDVKKIVALSTLSQLSVMMFSISIGFADLAFFHLIIHAMFKALLFMSVGVIIHSSNGIQDLRMLGGCWNMVPASMSVMLISNMSLSGLPFMSGFFSKDLIVDVSYSQSSSFFLYYLFMLGMMFTSLYSIRMSMHSMFSLNKLNLSSISFCEPMFLVVPYIILSVGSVVLGKLLHVKLESLFYFSSSSNEETFMLVSLFMLGMMFFHPLFKNKIISKKVVQFLSQLWFIESLSSQPASFFILKSGSYIVLSLEKGWLEYCGPQGLFCALSSMSQANEKFQYSYFMSCVVILFLICMGGLFIFALF